MLNFAPPRPPAWLPDDVLFEVFNNVGLSALIRAAGVCYQWRCVALAHQTFARNVHISSSAPVAVDLFLAQLEASQTGPLYVTVELLDEVASVDAVLAGVSKHFDRIIHAAFAINSNNAATLFHALRARALVLEKLEIIFVDAPIFVQGTVDTVFDILGGVELPPSLLGGEAPKLSVFGGVNLHLPHEAIPAFRGVDYVHLSACYAEGNMLTFTPRLFNASFPSARMMRFEGPQVLVHEGTHDDNILPDDLEELYIDAGRHTGVVTSFVSAHALATIPRLIIGSWTEPSAQAIMQYLPHELRLRMVVSEEDPENDYCVEFVDLRNGLRRSFVEHRGAVDASTKTPAVLRDATWHERVAELTVSQSLWADPSLAQLIPQLLPALKRLTVILDAKDAFPLPARRIDKTRLGTVVFTTPYDWDRVSEDDVVSVLNTGLALVPSRLTICMAQGLLVDGTLPYTRVRRPDEVNLWF